MEWRPALAAWSSFALERIGRFVRFWFFLAALFVCFGQFGDWRVIHTPIARLTLSDLGTLAVQIALLCAGVYVWFVWAFRSGQKHYKSWAAFGIAAVCVAGWIGAGAGLLPAAANPQDKQPAIPAAPAAPVVQPVPEVSLATLADSCAAAADGFFWLRAGYGRSEAPANGGAGDAIHTSHYDVAGHRCLIMIRTILVLPSPESVLREEIFDTAGDGSPLATYYSHRLSASSVNTSLLRGKIPIPATPANLAWFDDLMSK